MAEAGWRRRSYIGVDIGTERIKCMQLIEKRKRLYLDRYAFINTPAEGVTDRINKPEEVAACLKGLISRKRFRGKYVVLSLPAESAIMRQVEFPPMPKKEMAEAVKWEAGRYISLPPEEIVADYIDMESQEDASKEVLMVAVARPVIDSYLRMCDSAGLFPTAIEVESLSLGRAQRAVTAVLDTKGKSEGNAEWTICLDIGRDNIGFLITRNGHYAFSRSFNCPRGDQVDISGELIQEVRRSIEYYLYKLGHQEAVIERMFITGGKSGKAGLTTLLAQGLGMEVKLLNPFAAAAHDRRYVDSLLLSDAPLLGTAFGLSLRGYRNENAN